MSGILQPPVEVSGVPLLRDTEVPLLRDTEVPLLRDTEWEARRMRKGSGVERRALLCAAGGAAALSSLAALSRCDQHAEPRGRLRIATGPRGGVYYRLGEGLAEAA